MTRTELSALGEFGLINRIKDKFTNNLPSTTRGIGDDAAVIDTGGEFFQLISTDLLIEGVHFDLTYVPLQHLGYKSVAVNVSDIAAMNGVPQQITVSLGLSNRISLEAIDALYDGIQMACEAYGVDLVGGDTSTSRSGLVISVTAIGRVHKDKITYRNTAQAADILCVTGDLGAAYLKFMEEMEKVLKKYLNLREKKKSFSKEIRHLGF